MVLIKPIEEGAPGSKEPPKTAAGMSVLPTETIVKELNIPEFLKTYFSILIRIKHPYHHLDCMGIKAREISIDQRLPQLPLRQLTHPGCIDCLEERE